MKEVKIVSLAEHREARRKKSAGAAGAGRERALPGVDQLWELLDRNISITIWRNDAE